MYLATVSKVMFSSFYSINYKTTLIPLAKQTRNILHQYPDSKWSLTVLILPSIAYLDLKIPLMYISIPNHPKGKVRDSYLLIILKITSQKCTRDSITYIVRYHPIILRRKAGSITIHVLGQEVSVIVFCCCNMSLMSWMMEH